MTASFLSVLDNEDVITKIGQVLAASIQLFLPEQIKPAHGKIDKIMDENKKLAARLSDMKKENDKMKQVSDDLSSKIDTLLNRINYLEQAQLKNNIIIYGVKETYAELTDQASSEESPPANREDSISTECSLFKELCSVNVTAANIQAANRLRSKSSGPYLLLVSFYSTSLRTSVVRARRPKQKLQFRSDTTYIYEQLTSLNA